ncbi:MAG: hypothetical protein AAF614_05845 [Chloroflexota bacterium]
MTVKQIEQFLIKLPPNERLRLAHMLLSSLLSSENPSVPQAETDFEYDVNSAEWLTLAESSFEFWNNDEDAYYDNL